MKMKLNNNPYFTKTEDVKEYYPDGQLMYMCTLVTIAPLFVSQYNPCNLIINSKGEHLMRVGVAQKLWDNGISSWRHTYNDKGDLIKVDEQYQKDGSFKY